MKLFTNKVILFLTFVLWAGACSDAEKPLDTPATAQKETIKKVEAVQVPAKKEEKPKTQKAAVKKQETLSEEKAVQLLKAWDEKLSTLNTYFEQTTAYDGVLISRSEGFLYYDKNKNFLRLDTLTDGTTIEQSAVTDKKTIIVLDENGKEVTTLSWEDWQQGQPNKALFDFGNYSRLLTQHTVALESQNEKQAVLALRPKEGEEYVLYLTLDKEDGFPQIITIVSDLMKTEATLSKTVKNKTLSDNIFGGFFK